MKRLPFCETMISEILMAAYRGVPVTVLVGLCLLEPSGSLMILFVWPLVSSRVSRSELRLLSVVEPRIRDQLQQPFETLILQPRKETQKTRRRIKPSKRIKKCPSIRDRSPKQGS